MISQDKIDALKKYLISEFAECSVEDKYDSNREIHIFSIFNEKKKYITMVSEEFFKNNGLAYIYSLAKRWQLSQKLRDNPESIIIVTNSGINLQHK